MKLHTINSLLSRYFNFIELPNCFINDIKINSRLVVKGDLFIALKGYKVNGKWFIYNAVKNGAIAVLTYSSNKYSYFKYNKNYGIYVFYLFCLDSYLSEIAGLFYDNPSKKFILTGVTGTNGKTTVVNILSQWVYLLNYNSSMLSTIGNGFYNKLIESSNTTCSAVEIQNYLRCFAKKKVDFCSIEVSSHSLIENRINSLFFLAAIFTNLTLDHLDYHFNMFNYELSKFKLFVDFNINNLIINVDDPVGFRWCKKLSVNKVIPVSFKNYNSIFFSNRWLYVVCIKEYGFLKKIHFCSSWGNGFINTTLHGIFNIKNLLLSFVALLSLGFDIHDLLRNSKYLVLPTGRMEFFFSKNFPLVVVDYAHNPDSLEKSLNYSRTFCKGKLWCIFGCTGNRDKSKRSLMASIVQKLSDIVIVTNDDLYYENENSILNDIKLGFNNYNNVYFISNRSIAINFSIESASVNDLVLLLGKGHENYQIILDKKINFSDRYEVSRCLGIFS